MLHRVRTSRVAAILVAALGLACCTGGFGETFGVQNLHAQTPRTERIIVWDHTGLDAAGNPEDGIAIVEYRAYPEGGTVDSPGAVSFFRRILPPDEDADAGHAGPGTDNVDAWRSDTLDFSTLPRDKNYEYAVRVYDLAGNASEWRAGLDRIDLVPPAPPGNVRQVRVTVTVEVLTPGG